MWGPSYENMTRVLVSPKTLNSMSGTLRRTLMCPSRHHPTSLEDRKAAGHATTTLSAPHSACSQYAACVHPGENRLGGIIHMQRENHKTSFRF